ncbi:MAG: hypothetical protein MdMp014T_1837 [Treponematales bacterium]
MKQNQRFFKETGTKRDRLAFLRGLAAATALAAALVFGFTACEEEFGATVTVANYSDTYPSSEHIKVEITNFGNVIIAPGKSHTFEYDWKGKAGSNIEGTIKVFTAISGSSDAFNSDPHDTDGFTIFDGDHKTWYWHTKDGGGLAMTPWI